MQPPPESGRLAPWMDRLALFLAAAGILSRWLVSGEAAGTGINLFIHLFFWIALAAWFAARALSGSASWRFTGAEFALLGFAIVCLLSALRAPAFLPAINRAVAVLSCALLFAFAVNAMGRAALLSLLFPTLFAMALYALLQRAVIFSMVERIYDAARHGEMTPELVSRLRTREVFATFIYPNAYAGFLALTIPILGGALLDARGAGRLPLAIKGLSLGMCLTALFLTGSLGGWVAFLAGAVAFGALVLTRKRGRSWVVAAGAAAALAGALLVAGPLRSKLEKSHSMDVRLIYWKAAARTFATAPVLGVGLDNFEDFYTQHKSDRQQETRKAHNDYLQVLAETGLLGGLAFAALLLWGLRRALSRDLAPAPPGPPLPGWFLPAAAASAFLLAYLLRGVFNDIPLQGRDPSPLLAVVIFAAWLGYFLLARREPDRPAVFTTLGAAAGLTALLVHMAVDFDFYEAGVAMTLFLVLALFSGRAAEVRLPRAVCAASAAALLLFAAPLLLLAVPRAIEADRARDAATRDAEAAAEAQTLNPFDAESRDLYAQAEFRAWDALRRKSPESRLELESLELIVLAAIDRAIELRPQSWVFPARKAQFHRGFRRACLERPDPRGIEKAAAEQHLLHAIELQSKALDLYPTLAMNRYNMGRLLDLRGETDAARTHYREALRLSAIAANELEGPERLRLEPLPHARCLIRLGRPFDAHDFLAARLRAATRGRAPEDVRRLFASLREKPSLLGGLQDEEDEAMRSLVADVTEGLLRGPQKRRDP